MADENHKVYTDLDEDKRHGSGFTLLEKGSEAQFLRPGSFLANVQHQCREQNVPLLLLLIFCAEGNTIPDCQQLLEMLETYAGILPKGNVTLQAPKSWKYVHGPPLTNDLIY